MKVSGKTIYYNSKEFRVYFERLFPSMYMLASRILDNEEKGKDIAQEAFVKLWQKDNEEFKNEDALKAYMYVLVRNACISQIRKEKRIRETSIDEEKGIGEREFVVEVFQEEAYELLHREIKKLSPQAEKMVLLTLRGYQNQDIADELNVSVNTVKTVKRRAYKILRERLGPQYSLLLINIFFDIF